MEILVLIMLALFLIIIAIAVIIYVSVKNNSVSKKFDNVITSKISNDFDDDDDEDYVPLDIVMPSSFKKDNGQVFENGNKDMIKDVKFETISPVIIKEEKQEKLDEVINVLINKRNYIFLANNNVVSKNDHIKLILDGKIYFGTITKANYKRDISLLKVKPRKLIVIKNKEKSDISREVKDIKNSITDVEFVPIKKEKI